MIIISPDKFPHSSHARLGLSSEFDKTAFFLSAQASPDIPANRGDILLLGIAEGLWICLCCVMKTSLFPDVRIGLVIAMTLFVSVQAKATLIAIDSIVTSPPAGDPLVDTDSDGRYELNAELVSVTAGTNTYAVIPASSVLLNGTTTWAIPVDEPTGSQTDLDAISGLNVTSGLVNGAPLEFQFGSLTLDTGIVLIENDVDGAEGFNIYGLNSSGARLTTNITRLYNSFPAAPIVGRVDMVMETSTSLDNRALGGWVLTLRDIGFTESDFGPGELATLSGIEFSANSPDIMLVGLLGDAIIPEPSTAGLMILAGLMLRTFLRRRK
jgi:hypothetical protein